MKKDKKINPESTVKIELTAQQQTDLIAMIEQAPFKGIMAVKVVRLLKALRKTV